MMIATIAVYLSCSQAVFDETPKQRTIFGEHSDSVYSVVFTRDGKLVASGSGTPRLGEIKLWDTLSGKRVRTLNGHTGPVMTLAIAPESRILASGSLDGTIKLWDFQRELATLATHKGSVNSIAFAPDEKRMASGSDDTTISIWDVARRRELFILRGHDNWVTSVAFSPDGDFIASGSKDKTVRFWDLSTGRQLKKVIRLPKPVTSVAYFPDGKRLSIVCGSKIVVWDIQKETELLELNHPDTIRSCSISPDGSFLVSGCGDLLVRVWSLKTKDTTIHYRCPKTEPVSLAIANDKRTVVIGCARLDENHRTIAAELLVWQLPADPTTKPDPTKKP